MIKIKTQSSSVITQNLFYQQYNEQVKQQLIQYFSKPIKQRPADISKIQDYLSNFNPYKQYVKKYHKNNLYKLFQQTNLCKYLKDQVIQQQNLDKYRYIISGQVLLLCEPKQKQQNSKDLKQIFMMSSSKTAYSYFALLYAEKNYWIIQKKLKSNQYFGQKKTLYGGLKIKACITSQISYILEMDLQKFYSIFYGLFYFEQIQKRIQCLRNLQFFKHIPSNKIFSNIQNNQIIKIPKGQYLFRAGQKAKYLYVIIQGQFQLKTNYTKYKNQQQLYSYQIYIATKQNVKQLPISKVSSGQCIGLQQIYNKVQYKYSCLALSIKNKLLRLLGQPIIQQIKNSQFYNKLQEILDTKPSWRNQTAKKLVNTLYQKKQIVDTQKKINQYIGLKIEQFQPYIHNKFYLSLKPIARSKTRLKNEKFSEDKKKQINKQIAQVSEFKFQDLASYHYLQQQRKRSRLMNIKNRQKKKLKGSLWLTLKQQKKSIQKQDHFRNRKRIKTYNTSDIDIKMITQNSFYSYKGKPQWIDKTNKVYNLYCIYNKRKNRIRTSSFKNNYIKAGNILKGSEAVKKIKRMINKSKS